MVALSHLKAGSGDSSMLESIRKHAQGWFAKIILVAIILAFALFGLETYFSGSGGDTAVAKVNGDPIPAQEFERALRNEQDRLRESGRVNAEALDSPELREQVLNRLIDQRLLTQEAQRAKFAVSDAQVRAEIEKIPAFQENGTFSASRYREVLKTQGITPVQFEASVRADLAVQQTAALAARDVIVPKPTVDQLAMLSGQKRELSFAEINPRQYLSQVKIDDAAARAYYQAHPDIFRTPERVKVAYAVLSVDALMPKMAVSPAEIDQYYREHSKQFSTAEERKASHILINAPVGSAPAQIEQARQKAVDVLKQAQAAPGRFAELAKKYSEDPGSGQNGGDLGFFGRGALVKPFEDAAFAMQAGEIRGPVQSEFGFHIIKLDAIKPARTRPLEEVRPEIEQAIKRQKATQAFTKQAEDFGNTVYEQPDSLVPAAKSAGIEVQNSDWITRNQAPAPINNPKLLSAIFSDDALKNKRNTEAVEVAPNTLVSAHVTDYMPAGMQTFEQSRARILGVLTQQKAAELAATRGKTVLSQLQHGQTVAGLQWSPPQLVSRQARDLPEAVVKQAFRMQIAKLPSYAGVEDGNGVYTLIKVGRIDMPKQVEPAQQRAFSEGLGEVLGQEYLNAYLKSLRSQAKVTIKKEKLQKQPDH